nr:asparaginase [Acidimicrobiia bacterium]
MTAPEDDPVVATVERNGFVESRHRGRVVGLAPDGKTGVSIGAGEELLLLRSCAKPLQAAGLVRAGLDVDGSELAIASASHDGTPAHLDVVRALLAGAGLDEQVLDNTPALPLEPAAAAAQLLDGGPTRLHQNCSGKHAAMLATCVANGWPTAGYLDRDHPVQQAILAAIEDLAGEPVAHVATDGCGAPIAAVSLLGLARAFRRLATAPPNSPEG